MLAIFYIALVFLVAGMFSRVLTEWLSNRPESRAEYTQEEILAEIDAAYVDRGALSFSVHVRSVPVLLHRLTEAVGLGFSTRQADGLAYRVGHQQVNEFYHATYPVEVGGVASDLEFQWCREDEKTVRMAICAVDEILRFAAGSIEDLVIENRI